MQPKQGGCQHYWLADITELKCVYCARLLYKSQNPTGPRWVWRTLADGTVDHSEDYVNSLRGRRRTRGGGRHIKY
mgnify:CR=1 FL=1